MSRFGDFIHGTEHALHSAGSFVSNELLGIDDMRNAAKHVAHGEWGAAAKSVGEVGLELGGTLAAGAAIGLSGGAAAPGVAALYAGKVAAKQGAKQVAKVGAKEAMKLGEKKAAETVLKRAGAKSIEKGVLKSDAAEGKAAAKEALEIHKSTSLRGDDKFLTKGRNEIGKMIGEPPTGVRGGKSLGPKGSSKYGNSQEGFGGPGEGGGRGGAQGGTPGSRGPLGSEGGGYGGGTGGTGTGGGGRGGTATLERTEQRVSRQFDGPGGGGDEPTFRPKIKRPMKPKAPNVPGGSAGAVQEEQAVKIGAELEAPGKLEAPDAAARVFPKTELEAKHQLSNKSKSALGVGAAAATGAALGTAAVMSTDTGTATTTDTGAGTTGGGGGGGGEDLPTPADSISGGVGEQNVYLKRLY